jgi:ABC-type transport system substrate-binding protein
MGRQTVRAAIAVVIVVTTIAACGVQTPISTPSPSPATGGTLRVGVSGDAAALGELVYVDPAFPSFAFFHRCCLARTLLTYPGRSTAEGGTVLQPDLAVDAPTVSRDGITWTFRLRQGIRYAPPYEDVEVAAADIIRAVERHARLAPETTEPRPDLPYGFVVGAAEYASGAATTISGLSSPDRYTLVVRLIRAFGGFGNLVADVAWAPIPEAVADGHDDDLGRYWVSTGPYMFDPYPGTPDATTITLVRNPSWDRATDPRRGAWVDRMEVSAYGDPETVYERIDSGEFDVGDWPLTEDLVARHRNDPVAAARLQSTPAEVIFWIPMNVAVPPFDDVAVRRAVNAIVDRAALRDLVLAARALDRGPQPPGLIAQHVFPESLTAGLLLTYAPWASPGDHGDLPRARAEMSVSRYDSDGDGSCDAAACTGILLPAQDAAAGVSLRRDLARIGIEVEVVEVDETTDISLPANRTAIQVNLFGWGYNLTGTDLAQLLHGSPEFVDAEGFTGNMSLVGATPGQLGEWGYGLTSVPSVDDHIDRCDAEIGHLRARCWAELDQYVTDVLVPWVPLFSGELVWLPSARVADFSIDQSLPSTWYALDQVSLVPDAGE